MGRSILAYAVIATLFVTGPALAHRLDAEGLPGGLIVLGSIVFATVLTAYAVFTTLPQRRRSRAFSRTGELLGLTYRKRYVLPSTMSGLPFLALVPADNRSVWDGLDGDLRGRRVVVFERSYTPDGYEPTIWTPSAATPLSLRAPMLRVEARHLDVNVGGVLREISFESGAFAHRWRTLTDDRRFAEALVDQRMMAWLLELERHCAFELGGTWTMIEGTHEDVGDLVQLVDDLESFVGHIPRVVASLYPSASIVGSHDRRASSP